MLIVKKCPADCPEEGGRGLLHRHHSGLLHCGQCQKKWEDADPPVGSVRQQLSDAAAADADDDADAGA